jgi:hypothetical protein
VTRPYLTLVAILGTGLLVARLVANIVTSVTTAGKNQNIRFNFPLIQAPPYGIHGPLTMAP